MHTQVQSKVRVALVMANPIDCEVISQLLSKDPRIEVVHASTDLDFSLMQAREIMPQVLIVDPKCEADSVSRTVETVIQGYAQRAILLDDRLREGLVAAILPFMQLSYLTRKAGSQALIDAIHLAMIPGERTFDPMIAPRLLKTSRGWQMQPSPGQPSVATLTTRELEVLKLLAVGRSVRDCAQHLHLSESTIDNHKTRLMKKLQIHKVTELTHVAIRDGLIAL
jgi:DNA-binding NarL/FixJ family response regulator